MFYFIGAICFWIVVFLPFALWARHITREDALSETEAYILGQSCGPVGVWLVMRQNQLAAAAAYRAGLLVDHIRDAPPAPEGETPEQMEKRLKAEPPPLLNAGAYRAQHDVKPVVTQKRLDTVGLHDRVRPAPQPKVEAPPYEPPPPPATKAAIAWQPPPADYKFTHSDEKPDRPQAGGGPVDG